MEEQFSLQEYLLLLQLQLQLLVLFHEMLHFLLQLICVSLCSNNSGTQSWEEGKADSWVQAGRACLFPGPGPGGRLPVLDHPLLPPVGDIAAAVVLDHDDTGAAAGGGAPAVAKVGVGAETAGAEAEGGRAAGACRGDQIRLREGTGEEVLQGDPADVGGSGGGGSGGVMVVE